MKRLSFFMQGAVGNWRLLSLDFASQSYWQGDTHVTNVLSVPAFTHSRTGTRGEVSGSTVTAFGDNVPAVLPDRGLLVRGSLSNPVAYGHDLADAGWTLSNCARTGAQADVLGGTGAARLTDSSSTQTGLAARAFTTPADTNIRTLEFWIKKEASPTSEAGINLVYSGGTGQTLTPRFNALTGQSTNVASPCFVTEVGGWWRVMFPHAQNGTNTSVSPRPVPAARNIGDLISNDAAVGSHTFDFVQLLDGTVIDGPMVYTPSSAPACGADTASIDLSGLVAGLSRYAIRIVALAVAADGLTLLDIADASSNGFRVYRNSYSMWGVARVAGVEGTPLALGTAPPSTTYPIPLDIKLVVTPGGDLVASCNGNPGVTFTGAGRAYATAYVGHRAAGTGHWAGDIKRFFLTNEASLLTPALPVLFDNFHRADGALGSPVRGPAPVIVPGLPGASDPTNPNSQVPRIVGNRMVAYDETTAAAATYATYALGAPGRAVLAALSFSAGTDSYGGIALILSGAPNGINNRHITTKSLHITFSNKFVVLGYFNGAGLVEANVFTWNVALATDEMALLGYTVEGTTVTLFIPGGTVTYDLPVLSFFSADDLSYFTPEVYWANSNPTPRKPRFNAVWAYV